MSMKLRHNHLPTASANQWPAPAGPPRSLLAGWPTRYFWWLALIAVAVRLAAVLELRSYLLPNIAYEYGEIASNLVAGKGFSIAFLGPEGPTSTQAPIYPFWVAAFYYLFGTQNAVAHYWIQVSQAFLSGLLPVSVGLLMRRLVPGQPAVAWLSAIGVTFYPTLIYAVTQIQPVSFLSILVPTIVLAATQALRPTTPARVGSATPCGDFPAPTFLRRWFPSPGAGANAGWLGGIALLTDPIMVLVVLAAAMVLLWWRPPGTASGVSQPNWEQRLGACVGLMVTVALVISPWMARNYFVHGRLVPIKSTFGYAFWQGNHPKSWGTDRVPRAFAQDLVATAPRGLQELGEVLWRARHKTPCIDDLVLDAAKRRDLARLPEVERCRTLLREALDYIRKHPDHYLRLCWRRLAYFLLFDETNPRTHLLAYRVCHATLCALSLLGLYYAGTRNPSLWPAILPFLFVAAFHALTITSVRFRVPVEPLQITWAALGLSNIVSSTGKLRAVQDSVDPGTAPA
jgi:hypothetical protein